MRGEAHTGYKNEIAQEKIYNGRNIYYIGYLWIDACFI